MDLPNEVSNLQVNFGALLCGGALANAFDRIIYDGAVADFLNMSCCGIYNPFVFNFADVFILLERLVWPSLQKIKVKIILLNNDFLLCKFKEVLTGYAFIYFFIYLFVFCLGCSSDNSEVVDLYDIDMGEEIVVIPSSGIKIRKFRCSARAHA